jgi:type II secretory pathway predicted ATPase ExeA
MYMPYFGLRREPFGKDVDVKELFVSSDLTEAESRLKYITDTRGIFLLIGEPGSGKTVVIRRFAETLGPSLYKTCFIQPKIKSKPSLCYPCYCRDYAKVSLDLIWAQKLQ